MAAILNLLFLDSAILVFPLKLIHTFQDWFPLFAQKNLHSFILTELDDDSNSFILTQLAAILNSVMLDSDTAILDSDTLLSSLRLTLKHSPSTLTQTNSIWLTRWWQPSWILPSWIQPFCTKKNFICSFWLNLMMAAILKSVMLDSDTAILDSDTLLSSLRFTKKHSHSTLILTQTNSIWLTRWWQPSWILPSWILPCWIPTLPSWIQTLPSWIQTLCYLLSDSLKNTLTPLWFWLKLIQSD